MRRYKKDRKLLIILSLLLFIAIGYGALTTVLNMNYNIALGKATFGVHFDNIEPLYHTATVIDEAHTTNEEKTEISFNVSLSKLGDYYKFTADMINDGTIPARITSIEFDGLTDVQEKLVSYRIFYTGTDRNLAVGDYIGPETTRSVTMEIIYKLTEDIVEEELPTSTMSLECTLVISFENKNLDEFRSSSLSNKLVEGREVYPTTYLDFTTYVTGTSREGIFRIDGTEHTDYPIYVYRGGNHADVTNHVLLGGYCWRIIRTTSTGGAKIIYNGYKNSDGLCPTTGGTTQIGQNPIGSTNDYATSSMKNLLENWYYQKMIYYKDYFEDTEFCNDKNYVNGYVSLDCDPEYILSVANGKLRYPIGLLTAPEANLCGQTTDGSGYGWLNTGFGYWGMSATAAGDDNHIWRVDSNGHINYNVVTSTYSMGIRPVLSLNSEVRISSGTGTRSNPYILGLG